MVLKDFLDSAMRRLGVSTRTDAATNHVITSYSIHYTKLYDDLRLSVRHVAFHTGADYAVRILEASRDQDKYWETLEALLASQGRWVQNHVVQPERIRPAIASVGLDWERLEAEMNSSYNFV